MYIFNPEAFGFDSTCSVESFWVNKVEPLIHTEIEPSTYKIVDDLASLKDWGEFYAKQIKELI